MGRVYLNPTTQPKADQFFLDDLKTPNPKIMKILISKPDKTDEKKNFKNPLNINPTLLNRQSSGGMFQKPNP